MAPEQTTSVLTAERRQWWDEDLRPFFPRGPEGDAVLEWESGRWVLRERTRRG